jgi:lipopolysaccharide transport system ATP-binding protein
LPALTVENLSKEYVIGGRMVQADTLREQVASIFRPSALHGQGTGKPRQERFWALKDVSFDVAPGEVVGIIGRNGAGKSTLLKILSRITEPTTGRAELFGRVSSLLEVGTGFHPELSGRENVFLNGSILGMSRAEIRKKFEEIVAFSGVEKFIDTPVKRYSSGMYVRLAFSVAAHLEPEILLVDEVLSVGDAEFQRKCMGKLKEVRDEGRTVLFVSHNMQAVSTLTGRCIVLSGGRTVFLGATENAIRRYLEGAEGGEYVYRADPSLDAPRITRVELRTSEPNNVQVNGAPMEVHIEITTSAALENAAVAFQVFNPLQQAYMNLWLYDSERPLCRAPGVFHLVCRIPKLRLYMGHYTLTVHFSERLGKRNSLKIENICPFEVVMYGRQREFGWSPNSCAYLEDCEWDISGR